MPRLTYLLSLLLERQLDAEADRDAAGLQRALVGGLHDAGPATGDHRVAGLGQRGAERRRRPRRTGCRTLVRAEPKTVIAGPSSASVPNPSTNSDWIRSTRHGSACTQSVPPRDSSSRWSVVVDCTWSWRRMTGPCLLLTRFRAHGFSLEGAPGSTALSPSQRSSASWQACRSAIGQNSSSACALPGSPGPKFTAGTPSAEKRATSVQPYFGTRIAADGVHEFAGGRAVEAGPGRRREVGVDELVAVEDLGQVRPSVRLVAVGREAEVDGDDAAVRDRRCRRPRPRSASALRPSRYARPSTTTGSRGT